MPYKYQFFLKKTHRTRNGFLVEIGILELGVAYARQRLGVGVAIANNVEKI
ncbi:MAG: hypothetical protein WCF23_07045 [Candidatus Nitrosopolaris sp.]